jgi:hypothetical protein
MYKYTMPRKAERGWKILVCSEEDSVLLGAWFSMFLPNVAKHSSSDSVVSHIRRADYR